MMRPALRRLWLKFHRWTALSLGWLLALSGLLGALLTVAKPLDQWAHPELFVQATTAVPGAGPSLEAVRRQLQHEFGPKASYTFRPPREPNDTMWVYVRGPWEGTVFFNAAAREVGRRGEHEGFYSLLFELHSSLLLGDTGKALLTTAALAYLFLLASGLVLWWPRRWPPSFKVHWRSGWLRATVDLHNLAGAVLGLAIAVSVATGAYMAWPPLRGFVTTLAGERPVVAPAVPSVPQAKGAASLDVLVSTAQAVFPGAMVGYVQVPAEPTKPVRIRFKLADDPHPNGLSSVWLHPGTGTTLGTQRWDRLDPGSRAISILYPLHAGTLGGPILTFIVGLLGLALSGLGATGLWLWWKRRTLLRHAAHSGVASPHRP